MRPHDNNTNGHKASRARGREGAPPLGRHKVYVSGFFSVEKSMVSEQVDGNRTERRSSFPNMIDGQQNIKKKSI